MMMTVSLIITIVTWTAVVEIVMMIVAQLQMAQMVFHKVSAGSLLCMLSLTICVFGKPLEPVQNKPPTVFEQQLIGTSLTAS
jgi:Na+(H+)/acetate symporter ActP